VIGGEGASNDRFAVRVHKVMKRAGHEAVGTGWPGFHQTLREVSYVGNSRSATVVQDPRPRLGSRLRQLRPLIELVAIWHERHHSGARSERWLWGEYPMQPVVGTQ